MWRFLLRVFLGLCPATSSFSLVGIGHGSTVPIAFASSFLAFMVDLGLVDFRDASTRGLLTFY